MRKRNIHNENYLNLIAKDIASLKFVNELKALIWSFIRRNFVLLNSFYISVLEKYY